MNSKPNIPISAAELRRLAKERLRIKQKNQKSGDEDHTSEADTQHLLHELQVHQIELEIQNDELRSARDEREVILEKYIDLYDFAPVGYLSIDERGCILEANLTGAALLGIERSLLINQCLIRFVVTEDRLRFLSYLDQMVTKPECQACEVTLVKDDGTAFWAVFHGTPALSLSDTKKWRVSVSDITALKQAEEIQRHLTMMTETNQTLQKEIIRRKAVEKDLKQSEQKTRLLLEHSCDMQEQLRQLSRRVLTVQEEERKRISRELHDEITQALVGINVHLETLSREINVDPIELQKKINRAQKLVEKSVKIAHRFAQELRPTVLDDLGLIPALHAHMKDFMEKTGIRVTLKTFAEVETLSSDKCTVLYRVAQEALTNVARHAHASRVDVIIRELPKAVHMQIIDNGQSFEVCQVSRFRENSRLGLLGMKERTEMAGGIFTIESIPDSGTTIDVHIPFKRDTKE